MFRKRLIATTVTIFALGVVFNIFMFEYDTFSCRALFITLAVISALVVLVSRFFKKIVIIKRVSAVALAVTAFSFGVLRVDLFNTVEVNTSDFDGKHDVVEFEVKEVKTYYVDASVVKSECGVPSGKLVRVYANELDTSLVCGDRFIADVKYNFVDTPSHFAHGITLTASATVNSYQNGDGIVYKLRKSISENSNELYKGFEHASSISKAVVIGDCSSLNSYLYSLYKSSGISHVLSISGLHLSLFSLGLYSFLTMLRIPQKFVCVFCSMIAIAYAELVGFNAGAFRSAIVFIFLLLFRMSRRNADGITSMFISLFLIVLGNPYSICSVGLQLSYLCSLGIILAQPVLNRLRNFLYLKFARKGSIKNVIYKLSFALIAPFVVTFASTIFSFPIICSSFDTVSYISPIINLFAVPLYSYAIGIAIVAFVVAPMYLPLAKLIAYPVGFIFDVVTNVAKHFHDSDIGSMSAHVPYMLVPIILSLLMIFVLVFVSKRKVSAFVSLSVLFSLSLWGCWFLTDAYVADKKIIQYGNGSSEYIYCQISDMNIYVDVGGYSSETDVVYENGLVSLDKYILIDYTKYSLKRFDKLSGNMKVDTIFLKNPTNSYETDIYLQIKELANARNCDIVYYDSGISNDLNEELYIEVYDDGKDTIIRADTMGKTVRFIGGDFDKWLECDVIIALNDYKSDGKHFDAYDVYVNKDYYNSSPDADAYFNRFDEMLRIEMNQEGQFKIYEP